MRRLTAIVFVLLAAGCAGGPDAKQAQDLLARAEAAEAELSSVSYSGKTTFALEGQRFGFAFSGAAVLRGPARGDQWMRMTSDSLPGTGAIELGIVRRGSELTMTSNGQRQTIPVPAGLAAKHEAWGALGSLDVAQCVKKVDVAEGRSLNGRSATRIAGVIDTGCAFEAISSVSSLGQNTVDLRSLEEHVGDARATLYVSPTSGLLIGGVLSLELEAEGQKLRFELAYRLTGVNQPVRFPS